MQKCNEHFFFISAYFEKNGWLFLRIKKTFGLMGFSLKNYFGINWAP